MWPGFGDELHRDWTADTLYCRPILDTVVRHLLDATSDSVDVGTTSSSAQEKIMASQSISRPFPVTALRGN
eukprot:scaffold450322_cov19-Prasinocladus_malaysianus.AAC.1